MPGIAATTECFVYRPRIAPLPKVVERRVIASVQWRNGAVVRAPNWLGDSLMAMPAVHKLSRLMPVRTGLAVVCPAALMPLWEAAEWVTLTIGLADRRATGAAARRIRQFGAGLGVVLPNSFGSALDLFGKGIPVRVGRAGRGRRLLLTHCTPKWTAGERIGGSHQLSHLLDIISLLGSVERDTACPPLAVPDARCMAAAKGIRGTGGWLAIAPGAAYGPAKQWPAESFAECARQWRARGGRVTVLGGDADARLGELIAARVDGVLDLCGKTTLGELMAVLTCVDLCVANDSGIMHLAAAVGTSGAAIFGSTNPAATGPLGAPWIVLRKPLDCSPCFQRACALPAARRYACLKAIAPAEVMDALDTLRSAAMTM